MVSPPPSSPPTPPPPYEELPHPSQYTSPTPDPALASAPSSLPSVQSPPPLPSRPPISSDPSQSSLSRKPVPQASPSSNLSPSPTPNPSNTQIYNDWKFAPDPRSSSTQSLLPTDHHGYMPSPSLSSSSTADSLGRRTLLVIYIHGFLGNDESFRSFPAHVHALLTNTLAESHVIHSKIYPRYKTYRAVDVARDNFSSWLAPHESPTTDVILVGHSMGGILAADIVLMPNPSPYGQSSFKHRILGHVSLDCPFLGLHPGIIVSGISSLFKPAPQPHDSVGVAYDSIDSPGPDTANLAASQSSISVSSSSLPSSYPLPPSDPYFNPPFFNDAAFREQPFVRRALHFASKYRSENLVSAAAKHAMSYLEYGGVLADQAGLEARYHRLRALEDVDELQPTGLGGDPSWPTTKVRFVNYYTICNGRPKSPKPGTPKAELSDGGDIGGELEVVGTQNESTETKTLTEAKTEEEKSLLEPKSLLDEKDKIKASKHSSRPSITIEDHDVKSKLFSSNSAPNLSTTSDTSNVQSPLEPANEDLTTSISEMSQLPLQEMDPIPIDDDVFFECQDATTLTSRSTASQDYELDLLPIPDEPTPPELPDTEQYTDKDARKQAEREAKRLQRAYEQAVKDRTKAIHEREKIIEKRRRKATQDAEKLEKNTRKEALKEAQREEKEARKEADRLEKDARKEAERLEKDARKEAERLEKEAKKDAKRKGKEALKEQRRLERETQRLERETLRNQSFSPAEPNSSFPSSSSASTAEGADSKPRKLRQFCNLPDPAPSANGGYERDHTWVEIFMADVDEVGAHCGLFVPGPHYERLVGDVGSRILAWVQEDLTKRAILEMRDE